MPTVSLSPIGNGVSFLGTSLVLLNGGFLNTYQAGTNTPLATYTTNAGNVTNSNPIILNSDGRPPQEIWLIQGNAYKFVLSDALSNVIATYDNIVGADGLLRADLANASNAALGDKLVAVHRTAANAIATTEHDWLEGLPVYNVKTDFGAVGDGATDDTAAIQAAIVAAQSLTGSTLQGGGGIVLLPPGNYKITSTLSITSGCSIVGCGFFVSVLKPTASTSCIQHGNSQAPVMFKDFGIQYDTQATSASIIGIEQVIPGNIGIQFHARYSNLFIQNAGTGVSIKNGSYWTMHDCFMYTPVTNGISLAVDNLTNYDQGDITVTGCTFNSPLYGVKWTGADGFRFIDNKIIGPTYGLFFQMAAGNNGSDIQIIGNSIEGIGANCIVFTRAGITGAMNCAQIVGNQMGLTATGTAISVPTDATGAWLYNLMVNDNILVGPQGASSLGIGIDSVIGFTVVGNIMNSQFSGGSGTQFLFIGTAATNGEVDDNAGSGTFAASANGSASTRITNTPGWVNENTGTGTITAAVTSVVITHGLSKTPTLANIRVSLGILSTVDPGQIYIDTITSTQFTVHCRNAPGASTLTFGWSAKL
jgi:hypothetical protein